MRRLPLLLGVSLLIATGGCANPMASALPPARAAFVHGPHLDHWASGRHKQEKIGMHLAAIGLTEAPDELVRGECVACHTDLPELTACAGCHVVFQDATLRNRKDVRTCVGCHRGAWTGAAATLPRIEVCATCHRENQSAGAEAGDSTPRDLSRLEYTGGMRLSMLPGNVYFSHVAHVRFGQWGCATCHTNLNDPTGPPTLPAASMIGCLRCHVENGASTDCLTCHK